VPLWGGVFKKGKDGGGTTKRLKFCKKRGTREEKRGETGLKKTAHGKTQRGGEK